jgi:hypothetical protein
MHEDDRRAFDAAFRRLVGAFRVRLSNEDREELATTYFRVLGEHAIEPVLTAAKGLIATSRRFPLVAEWREAITGAPEAATAAPPPDVRQMGATEASELARAVALRYADHPCLCSECCRAGVDERELRFVPTLFGDEDARAYNPLRLRVEVIGHWAHGEELANWYTARDAFYATAKLYPKLRRRVLALIGEREPGEEG